MNRRIQMEDHLKRRLTLRGFFRCAFDCLHWFRFFFWLKECAIFPPPTPPIVIPTDPPISAFLSSLKTFSVSALPIIAPKVYPIQVPKNAPIIALFTFNELIVFSSCWILIIRSLSAIFRFSWIICLFSSRIFRASSLPRPLSHCNPTKKYLFQNTRSDWYFDGSMRYLH